MRKEKMIRGRMVRSNGEIMGFKVDRNEVIRLNEWYMGDLRERDMEKEFGIDYEKRGKLLKVVKGEKCWKLYGISEKDFLEYGVEVEENRKEVK